LAAYLVFLTWPTCAPAPTNLTRRRSDTNGVLGDKQHRATGPTTRRITKIMAVKLNRTGYSHARTLVDEGKVVLDERDDWSEHRPSAQEENDFVEKHGFREYRKWYLGVDDEEPEDTKTHYRFPYGDFERVHRCGVISAESRAGQYKHFNIEKAAHRLHEMLDSLIRA
jgi:hypothetical protein